MTSKNASVAKAGSEIIIVVLQVSNISKGIIHVKSFAGSLADGDFSIKPIEVKSSDSLTDTVGSFKLD
ncbi:MAG: hypothetical protein K5929_10730 [Lachnospiraceae bacterium]|nr:hypothetical protein [Lachnospiraceae bacterium]